MSLPPETMRIHCHQIEDKIIKKHENIFSGVDETYFAEQYNLDSNRMLSKIIFYLILF